MNTAIQKSSSKTKLKNQVLRIPVSRAPAKKTISAPPGAAKGDDDLMSKQPQIPK